MGFIDNLFAKKYYVLFVKREQETYTILRKVKIKPDTQTIQYKDGNSHEIKTAIPTYMRRLSIFYMIDIHDGQIFFEKDVGLIKNPRLLDMIVKGSVIKQLTASLYGRQVGTNIMMLIFAFLFGGFVGFVISGFI